MRQGNFFNDGLDDPRIGRSQGRSRKSDPETAVRAGIEVVPRAGSWQMKALQEFCEAGIRGLTDYELAQALHREQLRGSVSKYRCALRDMGWVYDGGERRRTDTGSRAIVWTLTPEATRIVSKRGWRATA